MHLFSDKTSLIVNFFRPEKSIKNGIENYLKLRSRSLNEEKLNSHFCGNMRNLKRCPWIDFNFFHFCPDIVGLGGVVM